MSSEKKLTIKRLVIFLVLAFFPFYIIVPVMWSYFGGPIFVSEKTEAQVATYVVGVFGMMIPSIALIITRLVTKEGFKNSYLGLNTKGRMGYFTASVIVPLAYSAGSAVLIWALFLSGTTSFADAFDNVNVQSAGLLMMQLAYSVICFFPAFGEEWGWRGYMMPKLMEVMPKPAAVIVGGIIWGLWHAPLTVAGHNFGIDYPGYPFAGIGLMCLMCTVLNAFLTLLTEKTKSIYPAAFVHAINNNINMGIIYSLFSNEETFEKLGDLSAYDTFFPYIGVLAVVGIISFILLIKKDKPVSGSGTAEKAA